MNFFFRDLKTENLLITENERIKLCDFGFARRKAVQASGLMTLAGTMDYMAVSILRCSHTKSKNKYFFKKKNNNKQHKQQPTTTNNNTSKRKKQKTKEKQNKTKQNNKCHLCQFFLFAARSHSGTRL